MDIDRLIAEIRDEAPPPRSAPGLRRAEMVAMRDGARLVTRVFLPEGKGPWPVVLVRNPYQGPMVSVMEAIADVLNGAGYAMTLQDCRGTGGSEGAWEPFVREGADGLDTLGWLRLQPWQDGNIGMFGPSYLSFAQWFVADSLPPEVKTLFIAVSGTERHRQMYMNGMFRHEIYTSWAIENSGAPPAPDPDQIYRESVRLRPHIEMDERFVGRRLPWYREWVSHPGSEDPMWRTGPWRQLQETPGKVEVPLCMVAGWFDHHLDGMVCAYARLKPETRAKSRFIIGPWTHDLQTQGDLEYPGSQILGAMGLKAAIEWFDHFLKGKPLRGGLGTVEAYEIGAGEWRRYDSWPPATEPLRFHLDVASGDETVRGLSSERPDVESGASYVYDPSDPVPTLGGSCLLAWMNPRLGGARPSSLLQPAPGHRPDVLSFVSAPLAEPLAIAGNIRVRLHVASDAEDSAFTAKLMEVRPDGSAYNIEDGIASLAFREGPERPVVYEPGTATALDIEMWPVSWRVAAGSRLRLDVSSSNFPAYHAHPNRRGPWAEATKPVTARQTVFSGGARASFVEIPAIGGFRIHRPSGGLE